MKLDSIQKDEQGFTLVELMIVVLLSVVVSGAIYWSYTSQQAVYRRQEAVVDMQQNLRSGVYMLGQELRMAGYDRTNSGNFNIVTATSSSLNYTQDLDENGTIGGPNENVTIVFDDILDAGESATGNCTPANPCIRRNTGGGAQPFIDNVDNFELLYVFEDGTRTINPPANQEDKIRSVRLSILVRADTPDPKWANTMFYTTGSGVIIPPFNDAFRRRMLVTTFQCRNAAL